MIRSFQGQRAQDGDVSFIMENEAPQRRPDGLVFQLFRLPATPVSTSLTHGAWSAAELPAESLAGWVSSSFKIQKLYLSRANAAGVVKQQKFPRS